MKIKSNSITQTITTLIRGWLCTKSLALPMVTTGGFEPTILAVKALGPNQLDDVAICNGYLCFTL